ncbi:MAG: sigma-54-dependent Fis family transcriptional regulator [Acidobacteria bacterium]|nr:sigma-54-dependent Fis family transcriptional regulator [Acidobacteriota bacterium]
MSDGDETTVTNDSGEPREAGDERPIRLLLADDEEPLRRILSRELVRKGHLVTPAEDGRRALGFLAEEEFDVAILDVRMPGMDGLALLRTLKEDVAPPEVILLTGNATVEIAVEAMKLGAYDFVTKPCRIEVLDALVRGAARKRGLARENDRLKRREEHRAPSPLAFGWNSRAMGPVLRLIDRLAPSDLPVLILGESGVGKELVAREIHRRSRRAGGPFVDLNCAAIPDTLLESELFGHEKGAFTGAATARPGLMEAADGGTLLMDEVGELSAGLQVKLLRVLETMSFFRVGGRKKVTVNVRLVAATNRDLGAEAQAGRFRTDLYYRINAGMILVPALRERRDEIKPLADAFLNAIDPRLSLGEGVLGVLGEYAWPGNVRELRNVLERASLLARDGVIRIEDLPREIAVRPPDAGTVPLRPMRSGSPVPPPMSDARQAGSLQDLEKQRIIEVLESTRWHRGHAADLLGISVRTLYRKIKAYGLDHELVGID